MAVCGSFSVMTGLNANSFFRKQGPAQSRARAQTDRISLGLTWADPSRKDENCYFSPPTKARCPEKNGIDAKLLRARSMFRQLPTTARQEALGALFAGQGAARIKHSLEGGRSPPDPRAGMVSNINPVATGTAADVKLPDGAFVIPTPQTSGSVQAV